VIVRICTGYITGVDQPTPEPPTVTTQTRIDLSRLPQHGGAGNPACVDELYRHLAAFDLAFVQSGDHRDAGDCQPPAVPLLPARSPLRAELPRAAPARPATAGQFMGYNTAAASDIAAAIAREIGREVDHRPAATDAARAGALIADLL
jgi:hypothetical protein